MVFVVIFGRDACPYCTRAKEMAEVLKAKSSGSLNYRFVDIIAEGISKEDLNKQVGKEVETLPQIFVDQTYVGGVDEFEAYANTHLGGLD
mmetsp:Transcript_17653/g.24838  ORF Transcript_17653/g.24838 Transcript_17653/m.24838 type:complete len:90 (-) Transcript_17653:226-495(-)